MNELKDVDLSHLKDIWKSCYPASSLNAKDWIAWLSNRNQEKDINRTNSTLSYFVENNIPFIDEFIINVKENYKNKKIYTNFSYINIFIYLIEKELILEKKIPIVKLLDSFKRKEGWGAIPRFQNECKLKLINLLTPTEEIMDRFFSCYEDIENTFQLHLSEQKKIKKIFDKKYADFVNDSPNKEKYLNRLLNLCKGIVTLKDELIEVEHKEEYCFNFKILINNNDAGATKTFFSILGIYNSIMEDAKSAGLKVVSIKINDDVKKGKLENNFMLLSEDREKVEEYKHYLSTFNNIIVHDVKNKQLRSDYNDFFIKIKLKEQLEHSLPETENKAKKIKI